MKTSFLFGSGISLPSEIPSVKQITDFILNNRNIYKHTDQIYYVKGNFEGLYHDPDFVNEISDIHECLRIVYALIQEYYSTRNTKEINYEDIYYVFNQIADSESNEFENPALLPITKFIANNFNHNSVQNICRNVSNFIKDNVWQLLKIDNITLNQFDFLKDMLSQDYEPFKIFTLNHDLLLESFFDKLKLKYDDGFKDDFIGGKYWNPDGFTDNNIQIVKLHGSINWYRLRKDTSIINHDDRYAKITTDDINHTKSPEGEMQTNLSYRPLILCGTFNKMLDYNFNIYAELFMQFHFSLKTIKNLIVSGYGFCDKGINSRIINWISTNNANKLIVIHPNIQMIESSARGAIQNNWNEWLKCGKLAIIEKKIENVNWDEICTFF